MTVSILEKIRSAENLPSLPLVAVEVLKLARSDKSSMADIARVIETDPALTSRILKVANSSLFGLPRQVSSVHQAMLVLGMRTVKVMALTFSLVQASHDKSISPFDHQAYWRRSLTAAVAGRLLSEHLRSSQGEELSVAGLLSDIGQLAAFHADAEAYGAVLAEAARTHQPVHCIEQQHFGVTHEVFSGHLLDTWGLPDRMVAAIARHHQDPEEILENPSAPGDLLPHLSAAILVADMFCAPGADQLAQVTLHVPRLVGVTNEELQEILAAIQGEVEETAAVWALDIGHVRSYKEIQAEAVVQLAQLTMATELERAQLAAREQELNVQNRTLAQMAATDGLTGIANRFKMDQHLKELCRTAIPRGANVGMLLLDIDRFKKLNDTFGHQVGDAALRLIGECLRRLEDDRCLAARYGGEEFAIVLADTSMDELRTVAERVRMEIQQLCIPLSDRQVRLTASVGGALVNKASGDATPPMLIARADKCLYMAKQGGRNRVVCGEPDQSADAPADEAKLRALAAAVS